MIKKILSFFGYKLVKIEKVSSSSRTQGMSDKVGFIKSILIWLCRPFSKVWRISDEMFYNDNGNIVLCLASYFALLEIAIVLWQLKPLYLPQ